MWIIFIDWQPYWRCDWTMNIGANRNAHGKRTVSINKTTTSERLDSWASRLWRGIELVFKSLDCFTVRPIFFQPDRLLEWSVFHFIYFYLFIFFGGVGVGVLSSNAFTIWCCIPIIRPPRVIRRFKRRSCFICDLLFSCENAYLILVRENMITGIATGLKIFLYMKLGSILVGVIWVKFYHWFIGFILSLPLFYWGCTWIHMSVRSAIWWVNRWLQAVCK